MVAAVIGGLWLVVFAPVIVSVIAERRRSSVAAFEATIRGLDRSASGALALAGPSRLHHVRRATTRARLRRQQDVLGLAAVVVVATVAVALLRFDRATLAAQAAADQVFVVYFAAVIARNQRRSRS